MRELPDMRPSAPVGRRSVLRGFFLSPTEPRLRAGWRLLLQTVMQFLILIVLGLVQYALVPSALAASGTMSNRTGFLVGQSLDLIAVTLSIMAARRLLDRRSLTSLGLQLSPSAARDFAAGIGITFCMMGIIFALELAFGWLSVKGFAWQTASTAAVARGILIFLLLCLLVGWKEELMSRGYHLQTIASGTTLKWGWILSSAIFGVLHLANPNASWIAVAGIFLAGLFLGYGFIRTGQLWLPMGLHTGWNFFEGVVFGFPVSGLRFFAIPQIGITGPELWTGGAFGPEAGLILAPALLLGFALVHLYANGRTRASAQ